MDPLLSQRLPIAQLNPAARKNEAYIRGVVTIVWPYSSSKQSTSLLLVEPDFRLRQKKGQVRVTFRGHSALAVARAGITSGDVLDLHLDGATWLEHPNLSGTPGRAVDWELRFGRHLRLQKLIPHSAPVQIEVDRQSPTPEPDLAVLSPPETPSPVPLPPPRTTAKAFNETATWASPAFLKRVSLPASSIFLGKELVSEDEWLEERPSKRTRFGRSSVEWRFADRTPSPTKSNHGDDIVYTEMEKIAGSESSSQPSPMVSPSESALQPQAIMKSQDSTPSSKRDHGVSGAIVTTEPLASAESPADDKPVSSIEQTTYLDRHSANAQMIPSPSRAPSIGGRDLPPRHEPSDGFLHSPTDHAQEHSASRRWELSKSPLMNQTPKHGAQTLDQPEPIDLDGDEMDHKIPASDEADSRADELVRKTSLDAEIATGSENVTDEPHQSEVIALTQQDETTDVDLNDTGPIEEHEYPKSMDAQKISTLPQVQDEHLERETEDPADSSDGVIIDDTEIARTAKSDRGPAIEIESPHRDPTSQIDREDESDLDLADEAEPKTSSPLAVLEPEQTELGQLDPGRAHLVQQDGQDVELSPTMNKALADLMHEARSSLQWAPVTEDHRTSGDEADANSFDFRDAEAMDTPGSAGKQRHETWTGGSDVEDTTVPAGSQNQQSPVETKAEVEMEQDSLDPVQKKGHPGFDRETFLLTPTSSAYHGQYLPFSAAIEHMVHEPRPLTLAAEHQLATPLATQQIDEIETLGSGPAEVTATQTSQEALSIDKQIGLAPQATQEVLSLQEEVGSSPSRQGHHQVEKTISNPHAHTPTPEARDGGPAVARGETDTSLQVKDLGNQQDQQHRADQDQANGTELEAEDQSPRKGPDLSETIDHETPEVESGTDEEVEPKSSGPIVAPGGIQTSHQPKPFDDHQLESEADGTRAKKGLQSPSDRPEVSETTDRETSEESNSQISSGFRTSLSYYSSLTSLDQHLGSLTDVIAIAISSTRPVRAKNGPRHMHVTLNLLDRSSPNPAGPLTVAQIFRPSSVALPQVQLGDVVLLRDFKVQSQKRKATLTSTDSSGWAVFRLDKTVQIRGPPVELGAEEETYAEALLKWWSTRQEGARTRSSVQADNGEENHKSELIISSFTDEEAGVSRGCNVPNKLNAVDIYSTLNQTMLLIKRTHFLVTIVAHDANFVKGPRDCKRLLACSLNIVDECMDTVARIF